LGIRPRFFYNEKVEVIFEEELPMKIRISLIIVLALIVFSPALLLADPEGYSDFDWREIRVVKGGAAECAIGARGDDMFPETKAFFNGQGRLSRLQIGLGVQDFIYNPAGRLIEIQSGELDEAGKFTLDSRTRYAWDTKGKLTSISMMDAEGNDVTTEDGITYDAKGNCKVERLTPEYSVYKLETYDKDFRLLEVLIYTADSVAMGEKPEIESRTVWKYDPNGNLIEKEFNYLIPPVEGMPKKIVQKFAYRFDKQGNKIEQTTTVTPKGNLAMLPTLFRPVLTFTYTNAVADATTPPADTGLQKVQVEWQGQWYPAEILKQLSGRYLIHYIGYDSGWDEWVTKERIKF
jgi:hypothetical protein